jgi:hypothetical protein
MSATFPAVQCKRDTGKGKNCLQDDAEQGERGIRKLLKKAYTQKKTGVCWAKITQNSNITR